MKKIILISAVLLTSACATVKTPYPLDASRSDGVIKMSYEVGPFEVPEVNWIETNSKAAAMCQGWGYDGAQSFGTQMKQCIQADGLGGCNRTRFTMTYQCTGNI